MEYFRLQPEHNNFIDEVVLLANETFGSNYITREYLENMLNGESLVYISTEDDKPTGLCIIQFIEFNKLAKSIKLPQHIVADYNEDNKVGYLKSIAVLPQYKKSGTAYNLMEACGREAEYIMRANNYGKTIWAAAWKVDDEIFADKLFAKFNYKALETLQMVWFDDKNYCCIVCNGRCRCEAVIYYKNIDK